MRGDAVPSLLRKCNRGWVTLYFLLLLTVCRLKRTQCSPQSYTPNTCHVFP